MKRLHAAFIACLLASAGLSCEREERVFRVQPPHVDAVTGVQVSELYPGTQPALKPGTTQPANAPVTNEYERNAYAMTEGKRLYNAYNCVGCHAHGGGGMGPPLMDDEWLYGYQPEQVYASILQGRPNGMPAFGGKVADHQIWQLAGYVRSMSGQTPPDAAPGRDDDMKSSPPENSADPETPKNTRVPS
jgi:cytochrome c oxidase cbb3-type subunit 3